jgi:non-specific serine/threonine protein kinase
VSDDIQPAGVQAAAAQRSARAHQIAVGHNLPRQFKTFVGCEADLAHLARLHVSSPLLTLVGPGGVGKTRLALRLAEIVSDQFAYGVRLVKLGAIGDPSLVLRAVAATLGITERGGEVADVVVDALRHRHLLLVLHSCEHLVDASSQLIELVLRNCPAVAILVTSRMPLRVPGESTWRVRTLAVPDAVSRATWRG